MRISQCFPLVCVTAPSSPSDGYRGREIIYLSNCVLTSAVGRRHTSLDLIIPSNAFSCNFANNGQRNSVQLSNLCGMCWKDISKITFNIRWNLKQILHSWHTWVTSKGWEQWGLSGLISVFVACLYLPAMLRVETWGQKIKNKSTQIN